MISLTACTRIHLDIYFIYFTKTMDIDDKVVFRIYKPTRTATQSGLGNTRFWYLKIEPDSYYIEPLMGWVGSKNPKKQIVLKFDSLEKAVSYVRKRNVKYVIEIPKNVKRLPKSYVSNFVSK